MRTTLRPRRVGQLRSRRALRFSMLALAVALGASCGTAPKSDAPGDENAGAAGSATTTGGTPGSGGASSTPSGASGSAGSTSTAGGAGTTGGASGTGGEATGGSSGIGGSGVSGGGTGGVGGANANGGAAGTDGGAQSSGAGAGGASPGGAGSGGSAGTGAFSGKELFILFGQSNMSGMSPMPEEPWPIDEAVTFMVQYDCPSLGQTKDQWLPAEPPLHGCQWATGGIGLGLADHFGAALAAAWPDAEIGLIPNAIPAVTIEIFTKGGPSPGGGLKALPDGYTSAYTLMVDRVREAQKLGRVRGILLHQGESDFNQGLSEGWLEKLQGVVADLRADLDLGEDVPFIAGEISPASSYSGHNVYINQVPSEIPNSAVVSAEGTDIHDVAHFDAESARIMGERYAEAFLTLVAER